LDSVQVARTVRDRAYQLVTESLGKQNLPPVTVSIGVATYPDDVRNAGDLIEAADQAMYVVKHSGGDRIHAYSESRVTLS
jgi:diguanylate cyclase (GGDEF)-like protein